MNKQLAIIFGNYLGCKKNSNFNKCSGPLKCERARGSKYYFVASSDPICVYHINLCFLRR